MKKVATLILNRNLPNPTDLLFEKLSRNDGDITDIYIVEAGSDKEKLSKNATWHADWEEAKVSGLRYARGMNYGLSQLYKNNLFYNYDAFFLITNDTEFDDKPLVGPLFEELYKHSKLGLISPSCKDWGENQLLTDTGIKFFWNIENTAYLLKRKFIEAIMETEEPDYMNFIFDGTNFRGYGVEAELIAKGYVNEWASAITNIVYISENEDYLKNNYLEIKIEDYETNHFLFIEEGKMDEKKIWV